MRYRSFYIVRHGESVANAGDYPAGQSDSRLTKRGRVQAQAKKDVAAWLHPRPDFIVASPLYRAARTAHILNEVLDLPVYYDRWLREQHYGSWQGRGKPGIRAKFGPSWRDAPPKGETFARFSRRAVNRVMNWSERSGSSIPMFVCHGGVLEAVARAASGIDLRYADNCAIVWFEEMKRGGKSVWNVEEIRETVL